MAMNPVREVHSAEWGQRWKSAQRGLDRVARGVLGDRACLYPEGRGRVQGESLGTFVPTGNVCQAGGYPGSVQRTSGQGPPLGRSLVWNGLSRLGFQVWRWLLSQGKLQRGLDAPHL